LGEKLPAMAKDKKSPAKKSSTTTKVTRITASDDTSSAVEKKEKVTKAKATPATTTDNKEKRRSPIRATADYFGGAWYELRQVRWPNRQATWGMTVALLAFTAFFVVLILLLDALFKYVFQLILG
jgi:preprotein translocase subunit SecE